MILRRRAGFLPFFILYGYNEKEKQIAQEFADLNKQFIGIQRIDFIKLYNGKIKLLEIEDAAPYLDLDQLDVNEEVDDLVLSAESNRRFSNFVGQLMQPGSASAGQNHG